MQEESLRALLQSRILEDAGRLVEAEQVLRDFMEMAKDETNALSWSRLILRRLAALKHDDGDVEGAIACMNEIIEMANIAGSVEDNALLHDYYDLAQLYIRSSQPDVAESLLRRVITEMRATPACDPAELAGAALLLVETACLRDDFTAATEYLTWIRELLDRYEPITPDQQRLKEQQLELLIQLEKKCGN